MANLRRLEVPIPNRESTPESKRTDSNVPTLRQPAIDEVIPFPAIKTLASENDVTAEDVHQVANLTQDEQQVGLKQWFTKKLADPSWSVSLCVHLAILLLFAFWMLPRLERPLLLVFGEQVERAEMVEPELVLVELDSEELLLENDLETEEISSVELDTQIDLDVQLDGVPEDIGFTGQLVEHNAGFVKAVEGSTEGTNQTPAMSAAAQGIQEQVKQAGGKSGEVQFSLVWKTIDDLDLHVVSPQGERIHYRHRGSRCGGLLDVDRNADDRQTTITPVENIRWLKGKPREGRYTVILHLFKFRSMIPMIRYEMMSKTGTEVDIQKKEIAMLNRLHVFRYIYVSEELSTNARENRIRKYEELQAKEERLASDALSRIPRGARGENQKLWEVVRTYPHTDAAIEALKRIGGTASK